MTEEDYRKVLRLLEQATQTVISHQGELTDCDIRIRHLLSITAMETKRRLRERETANAAPELGPAV